MYGNHLQERFGDRENEASGPCVRGQQAPWGLGGRWRGRGTIRRTDVQSLDVCPALEIGHKKVFPVITLPVGKAPDLDSSR